MNFPARPLLFTALVASLLLPAITRAAPPPFTDRLLRDEAFWGDGRAEIAIFDATESRYGVVRPAEVRHILVRENFAADERVKADDWRAPGAYPVIKLVQTLNIPVGTYHYDQGHTAFWRVADGALIKFTHATNDSCGLTYKQGDLLPDEATWRYRAFTYWEGMSETDRRVPAPSGALFYDELPFKLRLLDWERAAARADGFSAPLMASVIGSKADQPAWPEASFIVKKSGDTWRVEVRHARGADVFHFDHSSPHALRTWTRWDGSVLSRRQLVRLPYWELNRPGDERLLNDTARR